MYAVRDEDVHVNVFTPQTVDNQR